MQVWGGAVVRIGILDFGVDESLPFLDRSFALAKLGTSPRQDRHRLSTNQYLVSLKAKAILFL